MIANTPTSGISLARTVTAWMPPPARTLTQFTAVSSHTIMIETSAPSPGTSASAGTNSES